MRKRVSSIIYGVHMTGKNSCIVLSSIHTKKVKKVLAFPCFFIYNQIVVTLIALKREVAMPVKSGIGFPWSECQVVKTGDKSLYELQSIYLSKDRECMNRDAVCRFHDTHGGVYSHHLSCYKQIIVRKGGGFFYGSKSGNENYIKSI